MKFRCSCGNIVADQTDFPPCKGEIIRDQDVEALHDELAGEVVSFFEAVRQGGEARDGWIRSRDASMVELGDKSIV